MLTLGGTIRRTWLWPQVGTVGGQTNRDDHDHGLMTWLKDQHEARGELRGSGPGQTVLEQRLDLAAYQDIRELSQRLGIWQATRSELLDRSGPPPAIRPVDRCLLERRRNRLGVEIGAATEAGFPLCRRPVDSSSPGAAETRPQAAIEIYQEQAEKWIEARGRERYQEACIHLTKVQDLYRQMSQESTWTDFIAELRRAPPSVARVAG